MSTIFNFNEEGSEKINMDELYDKKQQKDISKHNIFNRILNRIHSKIKTVSKYDKNNNMCWYVFPEIILGIPLYDLNSCITYCIDKLHENGFIVKYIHPNLLFISWDHWVPSYVRREIKNKTGVNIDGFGNVIEDKKNDFQLSAKKETTKEKDYKSIDSHKPTFKFNFNDHKL